MTRQELSLLLEGSDEQKVETVASIGRFLGLMFDEPNTVEGHLWQCRKLLVRHYLYQCELYEPGWPPDAITALAWKLADLVMEVIGPHARTKEDPIQYVQKICKDVILPMTQRREFVARLIRRPLHQTLYRLSSLDETFGSPFGFWLLCEVEPMLPQLLEDEVFGPIVTKSITKLIIANGPFVPAQTPQGVLFCLAADQWKNIVDNWLQNDAAPDRDSLAHCVTQYKGLTDPPKLEEAIQFLPTADKETRAGILYQVDRLARLDHLPADPLWRAISNEKFQQAMLESFDIDDLKSVINAIVTVQQSQSPEWSWQLPFVFLGMLKCQVAIQHIEAFTSGLIAASGRA